MVSSISLSSIYFFIHVTLTYYFITSVCYGSHQRADFFLIGSLSAQQKLTQFHQLLEEVWIMTEHGTRMYDYRMLTCKSFVPDEKFGTTLYFLSRLKIAFLHWSRLICSCRLLCALLGVAVCSICITVLDFLK